MFQNKLKMLREAAGFKSQQSFANAFGVAQSTVGNWEAGKREPDYETTKKLAEFFNVPIDFLLEDDYTPVVIERSGQTVWADKPISFLMSLYHVPVDVLADIAGTDQETVRNWTFGSAAPSDEEYRHIADFFELDLNELKSNRLPLFAKEDIQLKVYGATDLRFAAYGKRNDYSPEELGAIQAFLQQSLKELEEKQSGK